jgi:DNA-binding CsgD family transcriptional regulator
MTTLLLSPFDLQSVCSTEEIIHITSITEFLTCNYDVDTLIIDLPILYQDPNLSVVEILFMIFTIYRCRRMPVQILGGVRDGYPKSMMNDVMSAGLDRFVDIGVQYGDGGRHACSIQSQVSGLNYRQKHILRLICDRGLSNKQIGVVLKISESAVKSNIGIILRTFGLRSRTQLAVHIRKYSTHLGMGQ